MSTLQYSISSVSTASAKALQVLDNINSKIYTFPTGTGLFVENYSTSAYDFKIAHPMVGVLVIPIAAINDFSGTTPAGNDYLTDCATLQALMP